MTLTAQKILGSKLPKNFLQCVMYLEESVKNDFFTSWSFANHDGCVSAYWADECLINNKKNIDNLHPCFDLASLTKPFLVNLFFREKFKDNYLNLLLTPLKDLILNKNDLNKDLIKCLFNHKNIYTLDSFLSHYSGIEKWFWMGIALWDKGYNKIINKKDKNFLNKFKLNLNDRVIKSLNHDNYGNTCYSDINYFLLTRIIESCFLENMEWIDLIYFLNNSLETNFCHSSINFDKLNNYIPFYSYASVDKNNFESNIKNKYGLCNDNNANILSSFKKNSIVSGHSGFFGNIIDVQKAVKSLINSQKEILNSKNYKNKINSRFVFGLDTPNKEKSVSGLKNWNSLKNRVFGHLGYTGTSFWFYVDDKDKDQHHILLTNRTAKRKKCSLKKCPRIFIYNENTSYIKYFLLKENNFYECSEQEIKNILLEFRNFSKIIWNSSDIRIVPNINDLRINLAKKLWNI